MDSDSSTCAAADGSSSSNSIFCTNDDGIDPTTSTTVSPSDLFFYATIAFSTMSLSTILLMQLDSISRRLLSPERLLAKRRQEYHYATMQSCEYNTLQIRQYIGGGKRNYNPKSESSIWEKFTNSDVDEMECIIREEILVKNEGNDTNSTNTTTSPVIVALEQDMTDEKDPDTYYLFLAFPSLPTPDFHDENNDGAVAAGGCDGAMARQFRRRVRVPLVAFCELLAKAFEAHITSTTLCFVADASCGMGSDILSTIVKRCNYGVATIVDPSWMTSLALLVSRKTHHTISTDQFERIVFALCRLDAWRVRYSVGRSSRTVLFTLPGQACIPCLLPLIQKVFVHERHVYVYDGCCHSVELGTALRKKYGSSYRQPPVHEVWNEVSCSPKVISATFPMMSMLRPNRELSGALSQIKGVQASIVEAWMASVDTFLDMKSREKKNYYTPFVCRVGFLMKRSGIGNGDGTTDMSEMALKNVLEYITGSKSRALPNEVMSEAILCLNELRIHYEDVVKGSELSPAEKTLIEKCVFAHKSILIGEKTLLDTVQPKNDWSLKATKKLKSCACCIGGDDDDDDDEDDSADGGKNEGEGELSKSGMEKDLGAIGTLGSGNKVTRSKYVDGKNKFAFDPTMFNTK